MSSDDSNFYGDEHLIAGLEERLRDLNVRAWWQAHEGAATPLDLQSRGASNDDVSHLHNPYSGNSHAWQFHETVDAFLDRLPPATTDQTHEHAWIWIHNPHRKRKSQAEAQNRHVLGGQDEVPEGEGADLPTLMQAGQERLDIASSFCNEYRTSGQPQVVITRETRKAGMDAAKDILCLAKGLGVTCGKWMLFCTVFEVNEIWRVIAKATVNNELGIAAKVVARSSVDQRTERLICVYTEDFTDRNDVIRVAEKLEQLGLLRRQPLYYKPDAYTYLGIASRNPWDIRPSIYDTTSLLRQ